MVKQKNTPKNKSASSVNDPYDGVFALKLVLLVIVGSLWLKFDRGGAVVMALPVGLAAGIILVRREHLRIDRKIDYAVLVLAMMIGFWAPFGIHIIL